MQKTKGNKKNPRKFTINLKNLPPIDPSIIPPIYLDKHEDPNSRNESNFRSASSSEGKKQLAGGSDEVPRDSDMADKNVLRQDMKVEEEEACLSLPSRSTKLLRESTSSMDAYFNGQNQKCCHDDSKRKTAKSELHQLCAAKHWKLPLYECCKEEGPSHMKLFTFKVVVQIQETSSATILECFGDPQRNKKMAAEHAAEGALWYLRHQGFFLPDKISKARWLFT